ILTAHNSFISDLVARTNPENIAVEKIIYLMISKLIKAKKTPGVKVVSSDQTESIALAATVIFQVRFIGSRQIESSFVKSRRSAHGLVFTVFTLFISWVRRIALMQRIGNIELQATVNRC